MKKLLLLFISCSLILLAAGVSFAEESGSNASGDTSIEKKVVSIEERTNQLVVEGKTVDEITQALLTEGFTPTAITAVLVSAKLAKNTAQAKTVVDSNSDILGYTAPTGTGGAVPTTPRFAPTTPNANAGSFVASPSAF